MALPDISAVVDASIRWRVQELWNEKNIRVVFSEAARRRIIASANNKTSQDEAIEALRDAFMETERPIFTMNSEPVDEIHLG